ncbi:transporter [Pendulispora albinea]|uniref:Transporter n=1 Tax=Pendulispora albinea TaxID=2741071 RepID=A0ABZ2LQ55_9BACT
MSARSRKLRVLARALGALGAALFTVAVPMAREARACAVCGCGDPTLTAMGTEKPQTFRLRASAEWRHRTDSIGRSGMDEVRLTEDRFDAQVAVAPIDRLYLLLTVPTLRRKVSYVNAAERTRWGLGDIELRAKFFLYQDRDFVPRHLLAVVGGVKLPTAPLQRGAGGKLLPIELQPGTGSVDPIVGLSYAYFAAPISFYASVQGTYPTKGTEGFRAAASVRTTTAVQYQIVQPFALRLGIDTRTEGKSLEDGSNSRDSGGFIGFGTAEALVSPVTDFMLFASFRMPVLNALAGYHDEGPIYGAGIAYDF